MNTSISSVSAAVPAYAQLQREMHHALLMQNPDWIGENGESPRCEEYDRRFAELLRFSCAFERTNSLPA